MTMSPAAAQLIYAAALNSYLRPVNVNQKMATFDQTVEVLARVSNPESGLTLDESWLPCRRRIEALGWQCRQTSNNRLLISFSQV